MYFIYTPSSTCDWSRTSLFKEIRAYGAGSKYTVWTGPTRAKYVSSLKEAQDDYHLIKEIQKTHGPNYPYPELIIGNLCDLPKSELFERAFPVDSNHLPALDQDIELIYRFGFTHAISHHGLFDQMAKPTEYCLQYPELVRWYYKPNPAGTKS